MTTTTDLLSAVGATGAASAILADVASVAEPWWIAALVVPLAGFGAFMVKWALDRADAREKATADREAKREEREERRAAATDATTVALQQCVVELRNLNAAHATLPDRVVQHLRDHNYTRTA